MAWHPLKPETQERVNREHREEMIQRTARLRARLAAKAEAEGPDSLWAEMLGDHDRRHSGSQTDNPTD
jgi:hypothetical protein